MAIVNLEEILEMPMRICGICICLMILLSQNQIGWVDNENGGRLIVRVVAGSCVCVSVILGGCACGWVVFNVVMASDN